MTTSSASSLPETMPNDSTPMVYVVDDDAEVRHSIELLLESIDIPVFTFESAELFIDNLATDRPSCLLLDVRMPGLSGLELQHKLADLGYESPVIIMTAYGEVDLAVQAMKAGALDFVQKPFSPQAMLDKIQSALTADTKRFAESQETEEISRRLSSLTPRERQIMDLLLEGEIAKRIAFSLNLSIKTVDFHRRNMMEKMGAESGIELAQMINSLQEQEIPED